MINNSDKAVAVNYNMVDVAKLLCAVGVILLHWPPLGSDWERVNYYLQGLCLLAVPFFFTASGFFLYRKTTPENFSFTPTFNYVKKLLKICVLWTLLYLPVRLPYFLQQNAAHGVIGALLKGVQLFVFEGIYPVLWYLNATVVAVLLVSYLLKCKVPRGVILALAVGCYAVGLLGNSYFGLLAPLEGHCPSCWNVLKAVGSVILTTRNGFFEGFLFVTVGMLLATYKVSFRLWQAVAGLVVSCICLELERNGCVRMGHIRGGDLYLFLLPASFFLFYLTTRIALPDRPVYRKMRVLSTLFYVSHMYVSVVVRVGLSLLGIPFVSAGYSRVFVCTFLLTVAFSCALVALSQKTHFGWLKNFYS